ncbi:hypothetical protein GCM10014715_79880 [Streptomyces spiralis]|uniref:GntR C-terminal domain-containing protein n=1 Tax=Streptomyces spiralis TaxID=66376 RepID=A0A919E4I1_9ACTN|nr:hypothetical protein GCM10014715_79880 [Streptomyces spiralis]
MLVGEPRAGCEPDRDVLRWKQAQHPMALLRDTGELRRIVEPEAARARPAEIRALSDAFAAMEDAAGGSGRGGYIEADIAFHSALLDASGNRLLGSLGRAIDIALEHRFIVSTQTPGAAEASLPAHRAVVEAVAAGDPAAAAAAVLMIIEAAEQEIATSPGLPQDHG